LNAAWNEIRFSVSKPIFYQPDLRIAGNATGSSAFPAVAAILALPFKASGVANSNPVWSSSLHRDVAVTR
jgi:hypothetical protein